MDPNATDAPSVPPIASRAHPKARLPGEEIAEDALRAPTPDLGTRPIPSRGKPQSAYRKAILVTTALVVLGSVTVAAGYRERGFLAGIPIGGHVAVSTGLHHRSALSSSATEPAAETVMSADNITLPPPVDPQASPIAHRIPAERQSTPQHTGLSATPVSGSQVHTGVAPVTIAAAILTPAAVSPPSVSADQMALKEFTALQPEAAPDSVPQGQPSVAASVTANIVPPKSKVPSPVPTSPTNGEAKTPPTKPVPLVPAQALKAPSIAATQGRPGQPISGTASDPVAVAMSLKPAPLTPPDELNLLQLMTQLGIVVRNLRDENAHLEEQVANLTAELDRKTTDFDRRLSLAEAKGAIDAAMSAGQMSASPPAVPAGNSVPVDQTGASTLPPSSPIVRSVDDYHIQAASPDLAMLSTTSDGGGAASIEVGIGDEVPGIGRVIAIYQQGTNWVVQTGQGLIH